MLRQKKMAMRANTPSVVVATLCLLATGCGDSGLPMTKVTGRVTIAGEAPPQPGQIIYTQVAGTGQPGLPNRPAMAIFREDGRYATRTFEEADGLLPGTYTVRIDCFSGKLGEGRSARELSLIPPGWTPEKLVISGEEGSVTVDYDVPQKQ